MAILEIRNVHLTETSVTYELYFIYDESYIINDGYALGFVAHEYTNVYLLSYDNVIDDSISASAGHGNGGSASASFITELDYQTTELHVANITWSLSSQAVVDTRSDWSEIFNFGSGEYSLAGFGFSQVDAYNARDVTISSSLIIRSSPPSI